MTSFPSNAGPVASGPTRDAVALHSVRTVDLWVALGFAALAVGVFFASWRDTLRIALKDEECSYVLVAPAVILWLAWIRRNRLFQSQLRRGWGGILVLALGWSVYWYGYFKDPVIWRAGAVIIATGAFISGIGIDGAWRLAPALFACVFLIPVDPNGRYRVAEPLQSATADVTQRVCEFFGMLVQRSGNLLSVNGVDVTIAEACNGMRMVISLFLVCYVVAFTLPLKWWVRVLLLAGSPIVAIISNVTRLVPTVWVFAHYPHKTAEDFHDASGWAMTIVAFLVLMGVAWFFTDSADGAQTESKGKA